ncbi:MAG: hypothetical protein LQ340_003216 [Diploschistes diacapsis]|nr:MAG: hypothetical protein LQ340_003216 [Diploschistes diacapsis]
MSFFALLFSIPALIWHVKNRNLPASSMVFWIVLENTFNIINALVWPNDNVLAWPSGVGYCDVEIKLDIASSIGLLGSLCCILRSLAKALDTDNARLMATPAERQRQLALELFYCVGLPLVLAVLHFVIQPFRYYVLAIAGCAPAFSNSWLTIMIFYIWPPVVCLINVYYSILLIARIHRYRRDFSSIITSRGGLNKSRFLRLFSAAMVMLCIVVPTQAYSLYRNLQDEITTFDWKETHNPQTWQTVIFVPTYGVVFEDRWIRVGLALPVFLCFGWGKDAKSLYKSWALLLGLDRFFPSLRPSGSSAPAGHRNLHIGTSTTLSSASSKYPFVSKALKLLTSPFPSSPGKTTSTLSDTSSTAYPKPSPRYISDSIDQSVKTTDFALSPKTSFNNACRKDETSTKELSAIPLEALAARAQQRHAKKAEEAQRKKRPHSLYSLGSLDSETTYINSPAFLHSPHAPGPPSANARAGQAAAKDGSERNHTSTSNSNSVVSHDTCSAVEDDEEEEEEEEEGMGRGKARAKATKRMRMEKEKEGKRSWETAAQAMAMVQAEREYEDLVVGALT